jgi:hypothetical protein
MVSQFAVAPYYYVRILTKTFVTKLVDVKSTEKVCTAVDLTSASLLGATLVSITSQEKSFDS